MANRNRSENRGEQLEARPRTSIERAIQSTSLIWRPLLVVAAVPVLLVGLTVAAFLESRRERAEGRDYTRMPILNEDEAESKEQGEHVVAGAMVGKRPSPAQGKI